MATATARVPVLMSPMEKNLLAEKAKQAGISLGELFRRAAASYQTRENDILLEGMIIQIQKSTTQAENAINDALAFVEKSNQRIDQMEISGKKSDGYY
ncbi:conserved hypothetical protein [Candidatus Nitrotoga sp. HW29]|uniref:plasmid mobilization protein n=1 Tax=Candidatus Nitrotoga sp. HW29 TaxID=2886963 RepID=UPI001EF224B1|nr:hypothetical protein [Candidatus Nitrotoga sp. HW29]CAH1905958.1 conserved hypothetical protein [Candidatus Nitrotoga sp. HW29]